MIAVSAFAIATKEAFKKTIFNPKFWLRRAPMSCYFPRIDGQR
jgi:hypothetical protein